MNLVQSEQYKVLIEVVEVNTIELIPVVGKLRLTIVVRRNTSIQVTYTKRVTVKHYAKNV